MKAMTISEMKNKLNEKFNTEITELKAKQERMIKTYDTADSIVNSLSSIYSKLKFTEYSNLMIYSSGISLRFRVEDDFEFYMFSGFNKNGESKNRKKCLDKAKKYQEIIKTHIHDVLGLNVDVHINSYCFELKSYNDTKFILVDIYF